MVYETQQFIIYSYSKWQDDKTLEGMKYLWHVWNFRQMVLAYKFLEVWMRPFRGFCYPFVMLCDLILQCTLKKSSINYIVCSESIQDGILLSMKLRKKLDGCSFSMELDRVVSSHLLCVY